MANKEDTIKTKLAVDGEKEYKEACKEINSSLRLIGSEMKVVSAAFAGNENSIEGLSAKQDVLNKRLEEQKKKVSEAEAALQKFKDAGLDGSEGAKRMETALNSARAEVIKTQNELKQVGTQLNQAGTDAGEFASELSQAANESEAAGKQLDSVSDSAGKLSSVFSGGIKAIEAGVAAMGASIAAGLGYAVHTADEAKGALNDFKAATGWANVEADGLDKTMKNIYANNYGEDFRDIGQAMTVVAQSARDTDTKNIEKLTTDALTLRDTFGFDMQEQMRAVNMLIDQFGVSGDEAFSLIAQGAQSGLDKNGDLLDSINEYSVHFKSLGLNAEDMFNSLANGAAHGTFSVDKLGDAVKEFGIRAKDGSDSTMQAFSDLGLNAEKVSYDFAVGGDRAAGAFDQVVKKLFEMEDPMKQNAAGVALFGTMWEDLGAEGVESLTYMQGEISTTVDALADINKVKYDTFGEAVTGLGRILQTSFVMPIGEEALPMLNNFINTLSSGAREANGDIGKMEAVFSTALQEILTQVSQVLPQFATFATDIIMGLVNGLVQNLPIIGETATKIILVLVNGIVSMLPSILNGAVQIVLGLANGISQALPQLLPQVVKMVSEIVQALIDNIPMLIEAALQLVLGLANGLIAAIPVLIDALPTIIESLINGLLASIPKIIQAGIDLITSLVTGLPQIIQSIVKAIPQIIAGLVTAVMNNIPLIVQAGIDLLTSLIDAMPQIYATIVAAIPQIVGGIVNAFARNIDKIIVAGVQLLTSLVKSLPKIVATVAKAVPTIIKGLVQAFGGYIGEMSDVGLNLIKGVWEGIKGAAKWLKDNVKGFFQGIVKDVKGVLGIHSPSKVFAEIGGFMAAGLGKGFDGEMKAVGNDMQRSLSGLTGNLQTEIELKKPANNRRPGHAGAGDVYVTQNIYADETNYAKQQREAAKQFKMIAREVMA